ncbi:hypothetical protein TNCV_1377001 [Trichonephila clavipes]|nr:hypothetical protein TNCV_1377001 [Trichonephila clavipes]
MGRRIGKQLLVTLPPVMFREFRLALQDEWAAMPQQLIDTLILSMGRHCETCLAVVTEYHVQIGRGGREHFEYALLHRHGQRAMNMNRYRDAKLATESSNVRSGTSEPQRTCIFQSYD